MGRSKQKNKKKHNLKEKKYNKPAKILEIVVSMPTCQFPEEEEEEKEIRGGVRDSHIQALQGNSKVSIYVGWRV